MGYDYGIPTHLLKFLGACVYGDAKAYYAGLNEAERAELEGQGKRFGMGAWFYRYLYNALPEARREEYRKTYLARQLKALRGGEELKRLYRVLAAHGLRFVPIKGADMAYRLYPDTALRVFGDWDIWFHPDDCERALAVLSEDDWIPPERYTDRHNAAIKSANHHFSPHVRGDYVLEPHFTLANFDGVDPHDMWEYTEEYPAGEGQRVLSPEMNLLMLARHAASKSYYHAQIPKLLTDAAMVMKEGVDYSLLRDVSARWHLPYPDDLFAAFPEFFPEEVILKFDADSAKSSEFRAIFEMRGQLGEPESEALLLSRFEARGQVAGGVAKHIRSLTPDKMRLINHLPKRGAYWCVLWAYLCYFWTRGCRAILWMRSKQTFRDYTRAVESIESNSI